MPQPTDIRITDVDLGFFDETLDVPFQLSRGLITAITYVRVTIHSETRNGHMVHGVGAILLSDLWAFPNPLLDQPRKTQIMCLVCQEVARRILSSDFGDPVELGFILEQMLPSIARDIEQLCALPDSISIPPLALLNCLAPFDAAIHDAWGRAIGKNVYHCYTPEYLNADLGVYLGPVFSGYYPAHFLGSRRSQLVVQHVIGISDPLRVSPDQASQSGADAIPADLVEWIERDGVYIFKLKISGQNPKDDAQRVTDVYELATAQLSRVGVGKSVRLSCDPNEAYTNVDGLIELLDRLATDHAQVFAALEYIEQPTPRDLSRYDISLAEASRRKPVIMDESLDQLSNLLLLELLGWSGLAVKTCKGHTHSLLAYCWAKYKGLYVTIQDLTNPGLALVHSANMAAHLALSNNYLECNSRQYMPLARKEERSMFPAYFSVHDGVLNLPESVGTGIYG